jgi:hypothetical protein
LLNIDVSEVTGHHPWQEKIDEQNNKENQECIGGACDQVPSRVSDGQRVKQCPKAHSLITSEA